MLYNVGVRTSFPLRAGKRLYIALLETLATARNEANIAIWEPIESLHQALA